MGWLFIWRSYFSVLVILVVIRLLIATVLIRWSRLVVGSWV